MDVASITSAEGFQKAFDVSRETVERLQIYHDLLVKWQRVQNLVAPATLSAIWSRHFADSAQLYPYLNLKLGEPKVLADMGAGAGFPGMVLAIMAVDAADLQVHLIEANGRKCAFLKDVARQTGVHVEIHNCRIESFANESSIPVVDVVTARALKPLGQLLDLGHFAFVNGATGLFLKGQSYADEIEEAAQTRVFEAEIFESLTEPNGRIVRLSNIRSRS